MSDFDALMAQPVRLEPVPAAPEPIGSLVEVDRETLAQGRRARAPHGLPPALVVKTALRALEVELGKKRRSSEQR